MSNTHSQNIEIAIARKTELANIDRLSDAEREELSKINQLLDSALCEKRFHVSGSITRTGPTVSQ